MVVKEGVKDIKKDIIKREIIKVNIGKIIIICRQNIEIIIYKVYKKWATCSVKMLVL